MASGMVAIGVCNEKGSFIFRLFPAMSMLFNLLVRAWPLMNYSYLQARIAFISMHISSIYCYSLVILL